MLICEALNHRKQATVAFAFRISFDSFLFEHKMWLRQLKKEYRTKGMIKKTEKLWLIPLYCIDRINTLIELPRDH